MRDRTSLRRWTTATIVAVAIFAIPSTTSQGQGGCVAPDDCLPPADSSYTGVFHALYNVPGLGIIDLSSPVHDRFTRCDPPPKKGRSTTHTFESMVRAQVTLPGGPPMMIEAPAVVTVRVDFFNHDGKTRTFDTEMLQLDISGGSLPMGVMIRESPTLPSLGRTVIQRIPGGDFMVDSFFDIFTEVSLDGHNWIPSTDPNGNSFAGRVGLAMCGQR